MRFVFDRFSNLLERSYYDEHDSPMDNKLYGYHKVTFEYDEKHKQTKTNYYDKSGNLINDKIEKQSRQQTTQEQVTTRESTSLNWQSDINTLAKELPVDLGDNVNHLVFQSIRITGNYSCELTFKAPNSKYEMSEEDISGHIGNIQLIISSLKERSLYSSVRFTAVLKDSKERELKRF